MSKLTIAPALVLVAGAVALAGARVLPFSPLADARAGESARYKLEIFDASGRPVSTSDKSYEVASRDLGTVTIGKIEIAEDADAVEIVKALRLLPPGTPLEGLTAKPETIVFPAGGEKKVEAIRVTLRAALQGGATSVVFDAWFAADAPVFGLLRARTKILGGGAGESAWELVEYKKG